MTVVKLARLTGLAPAFAGPVAGQCRRGRPHRNFQHAGIAERIAHPHAGERQIDLVRDQPIEERHGVGLDQFGRPGRHRGVGRIDRGAQDGAVNSLFLPVLVHIAQCAAEILLVRRLRLGPGRERPELVIGISQRLARSDRRQWRSLRS